MEEDRSGRRAERRALTSSPYTAPDLEPFPFRWNRNGGLFLVLTRFLHANRYLPPDRVRGRLLLENAPVPAAMRPAATVPGPLECPP